MQRLDVRSHVTQKLQEIMLPIYHIFYVHLIIKENLVVIVKRKREHLYQTQLQKLS